MLDDEETHPFAGTDELIVRMLRRRPGITRSEIARALGLPKSSIAQSVTRLLHEGRAREGDAVTSGPGSGRPARQLFGGSASHPVAGVDFGHSHISVAVGDMDGNLLDVEHVEMDVDLKAEMAIAMSAEMLDRLRSRHGIQRFASIVAGIPGPVARDDGRVLSPTILSGWVGLRPALELGKHLRGPVRVENDATLGAIGEQIAGAARGHQHVMYVKVSDGIGASLILGGELYRGAAGLAGELGHTQLANGRQQCRCGRRGCLEAEVCTRSLLTQLRYTHPTVDIPTLVDLPLDDVTARVFDDAGRTVGRVLSDMCNLVNPSAIVIGGRLGTAHPSFLAGVRAAVDQFALSSAAAAVEVMAAELEDRSELRGAIHLAFETATA